MKPSSTLVMLLSGPDSNISPFPTYRKLTLTQSIDIRQILTHWTLFESLASEIVQSQRSDSKKDTVLKYTDAFYAEFADKLIQKKKSLSIVSPYMEKLVKLIGKTGVENCDQTKASFQKDDAACHLIGSRDLTNWHLFENISRQS